MNKKTPNPYRQGVVGESTETVAQPVLKVGSSVKLAAGAPVDGCLGHGAVGEIIEDDADATLRFRVKAANMETGWYSSDMVVHYEPHVCSKIDSSDTGKAPNTGKCTLGCARFIVFLFVRPSHLINKLTRDMPSAV